jgi:hypothetical protein
VRSWLKIHEAAEEKGRKRRTDRERKRRGVPTDSERNPDGGTADSLLCSYVSSLPETEQNKTEQSITPPRKRAERIPDGWTPDDDLREWTLVRISQVAASRELEKFRNYWSAKSGKDAAKLDWPATWRNWVLTAAERQGTNGTRKSTTDQRVGDALDLARRLEQKAIGQ